MEERDELEEGLKWGGYEVRMGKKKGGDVLFRLVEEDDKE